MGIGLAKEPQNKDVKEKMDLLDSFDLSLDSNGNSKTDTSFSFESMSDKEKEQFKEAQEFINDANSRDISLKQTLDSNNKGLLDMIGKALGIEEKAIDFGDRESKQQTNKERENDELDAERD